jgi:hypothetical protein
MRRVVGDEMGVKASGGVRTREDVENAMECLNRHAIPVKIFNMVGIPGETLEDALATLEMNVRLKPMWARCSILQPYPPMDLYQWCKREGLFREDFEMLQYFSEEGSRFPVDRLVSLRSSSRGEYPFLLPLVRQLIKVKPNASTISGHDVLRSAALANA